MKTTMRLAVVVGAMLSLQYANASWDLQTDWNSNLIHANPNGAWSYGGISGAGGSFTPLPWSAVVADNATGYYGVSGNPTLGAFVFQNAAAWANYGVNPGQIGLESDYGSAAVRWTAPSTGYYDIAVSIGGTTAYESGPQGQDGGYGNNFAQYAGLDINGNIKSSSSFVNNMKIWDINSVLLNAGATVDAYVINPGYPNGGNTAATLFTVTAVPEPTTMVAGALLLLPFGASTLRILRRSRAA